MVERYRYCVVNSKFWGFCNHRGLSDIICIASRFEKCFGMLYGKHLHTQADTNNMNLKSALVCFMVVLRGGEVDAF